MNSEKQPMVMPRARATSGCRERDIRSTVGDKESENQRMSMRIDLGRLERESENEHEKSWP